MTATSLTNLREVGGEGFQARTRPGRRTVYRANTEVVAATAYPASVATVIDLRRADEIDAVAHPLAALDGYAHVPFFDPSDPLEAAPDALSLEEQYDDWLTRHRRTLAEVLKAVAATGAEAGAEQNAARQGDTHDVLVCCSAGKDRTGVVSALLARLWGADLDAIGVDYALTGPALADRFARERAVSTDLATTARMQRCAAETAVHLIETVEHRHGSVADYLRWLGLYDGEIAAL